MKRREKGYAKFISNMRKSEQECNIPNSKRITMVPTFLSLDVISGTASKNDSSCRSNSLEKENIYGIFENDEPKSTLRRSIRLNNKKTNKQSNSVTEKSSEDDNFRHNSSEKKGFYRNSQDQHRSEPKRKCKSLINEINQRYAKIEIQDANKNQDFCTGTYNDVFSNNFQPNSCLNSNSLFEEENSLWKIDPKMEIGGYFSEGDDGTVVFQSNPSFAEPFGSVKFRNYDVNSDFCNRLEDQVIDDSFKEIRCKNKIFESIYDIQNILVGNIQRTPLGTLQRHEDFEEDNDPLDVTFNLVPPNDWLYETPTKAKAAKKDNKKRTIQPGIVYRDHNNRPIDVYEINPENVTIDLTGFDLQDSTPRNMHFFNNSNGMFGPFFGNIKQEPIFFESTESDDLAYSAMVGFSQQSQNNSQTFFSNFKPNNCSGNVFGNV